MLGAGQLYVLGVGQLDAEEFVQLVMSKSKSPDDEMREAWTYFDVDCNGESDR